MAFVFGAWAAEELFKCQCQCQTPCFIDATQPNILTFHIVSLFARHSHGSLYQMLNFSLYIFAVNVHSNRPTCDTPMFFWFFFEFVDLTLEIFNKCRLKQMILPLHSQREFVLLHSGVLSSGSEPSHNKTSTHGISSKTQRTKPKRWRSGVESKNVTSASPDDVSDSSGGQGSTLKSGLHQSTSSSLCQNSPSVQKPSHSHSGSHTVRTENHRPQVHLRLNRCTLHHWSGQRLRQSCHCHHQCQTCSVCGWWWRQGGGWWTDSMDEEKEEVWTICKQLQPEFESGERVNKESIYLTDTWFHLYFHFTWMVYNEHINKYVNYTIKQKHY